MTLRAATHADIPALVELGRDMHAGSSFAPMDFDAEVLGATFARMLEQSQFLVVAEDGGGEIVGGMAGMVSRSWFGKDWVANDLGLFLRSGHAMTAVHLLKAFVNWASLAGAKQIRPGVSTGHDGAERFYEGLGFVRTGALFVLDVKGD